MTTRKRLTDEEIEQMMTKALHQAFQNQFSNFLSGLITEKQSGDPRPRLERGLRRLREAYWIAAEIIEDLRGVK